MSRLGLLSFSAPILLALRNLRLRWQRTFLTTLGIIVGVAAMVAVNTTNNSTLASIDRFFDETSGNADLILETAVSGDSFSLEILDTLRQFPEVIAAAPGIVGVTVPADEADDWELEFGAGGVTVPGTNFWLLGRDPIIDKQVHDYELIEGRLLQPGETGRNMLLVDDYAEEKGVEVGEDFALLSPNSGVVRLRTVGLISKEGIGISNDGAIGIAPLEVVQDLFGLSGEIDQAELEIEEGVSSDPDELENLRQRIESRLANELEVRYPAARGELVVDSLQSYRTGLDFFSVVSLFVGSFLIYNAFAMTVVERTREIGMLRAVGSTQSQILAMVLGEAAILGAIGSLLGVGAGILLARGLVASVSGFLGRNIEQVTATPGILIQAALVGMAVTFLAALIPAYQASRISPLQALQVQGNVDEGRWLTIGLKFGPLTVLVSWLIFYRVPLRQEVVFQVGSNTIFLMMLGATLCIPILAGPIERLMRPLIVAIFGNEGRLGSGNINRARGRTTLTVASLMVGISMVVGINGLTQSFEQDIQGWVNTALGGDLFVRSPLRMEMDVESRLLAMDEIAAVSRTRYIATRLLIKPDVDEYAVFSAIDPVSYPLVSGLRIQDGPSQREAIEQLSEGDTVLIGADLSNKYGLSVGDQLTLETKRGQRRFRVVATIIDFSGGETITITGSWRDLRRYFGVNDVSTFMVRLQPDVSLSLVSEKIEDEIGRGKNLSVESRQEFEEKVRDLSAQAFALFDVLGLIGLVVAALGIVNTMLMNVLERTRELGGLRSLGMEQAQVRRMILAEAVTMGIIGGLFGLSFGVALSDVFILGLRLMGGFVLTSSVPYQAMIYSFMTALAVALGAAWYPAVRASRLNIIEAIKHE